ncbi:MAG: ABC transporter ATP-binding protein [Firmicutes bacterium]|nr:ABC transporter ATP-binding protein [Bacillota bacterium]
MESILTVKGLTKKYPKFTLGELDLEIPKGFATALIGANGAGKTTLIDTLCGVARRSSGEITYFGKETDIENEALRERIGYCSAQNFFPSAWRVKDIAESMSIAYKKFDRSKFAAICSELEVETEFVKKGKQMYSQSDGNRMRIALAAVFARETDLLILDEPGSSLDPLMRDRLCDRLRDYLDKGNGEKSVIFSTHNIADMENAADYAVFMDMGKIIEQGFVEDLKDKYIIVRGEPDRYDRAKGIMLSHNVNGTVFEGLAQVENKAEFEKLSAVWERPTLQQLSIGLLKSAEERR